MKKLNAKTIGIAAATAAMFVLAGCGESGTASVPPESLPAQELAAPQETAGTLLLSVNPCLLYTSIDSIYIEGCDNPGFFKKS